LAAVLAVIDKRWWTSSKTAAIANVAVFAPDGQCPGYVYPENENAGFIGIGPVNRELAKVSRGRGRRFADFRAKV